jgi:hypothetical protein
VRARASHTAKDPFAAGSGIVCDEVIHSCDEGFRRISRPSKSTTAVVPAL